MSDPLFLMCREAAMQSLMQRLQPQGLHGMQVEGRMDSMRHKEKVKEGRKGGGFRCAYAHAYLCADILSCVHSCNVKGKMNLMRDEDQSDEDR